MLEKTGQLKLTEEDLVKAKSGEVSERVKQTWGLTLKELQEAINSKDYTKQ